MILGHENVCFLLEIIFVKNVLLVNQIPRNAAYSEKMVQFKISFDSIRVLLWRTSYILPCLSNEIQLLFESIGNWGKIYSRVIRIIQHIKYSIPSSKWMLLFVWYSDFKVCLLYINLYIIMRVKETFWLMKNEVMVIMN